MNAINETWQTSAEGGVLRLTTAGSVDDGKSTLIGRLLLDSKGVFADQLASIQRSKYKRVAADEMDLALLTDGLEAEREQGITIDVAYRYFATPARKFIVADAPGHEQYTRNMVTGASTSDAVIILIDATRVVDGQLLVQTKRHSALAQMLGIRHVIVAVNKMDLLDWNREAFERIRDAYERLAQSLGIEQFHIIPLSALRGDNVVQASAHTPWYEGPPLLSLLETLSVDSAEHVRNNLRFFVQWVVRHGGHHIDNFRGYAGQLSSGKLSSGDEIRILPSDAKAKVARLLRGQEEVPFLLAGDSGLVVLDRDVDVSRGDLIASAGDSPVVSKQFQVELCWLDQQPLSPARSYWLKQGTRMTQAKVRQVHSRRDGRTLLHIPDGGELAMNDIGLATLVTRDALAIDDYGRDASMGSFILIDTASHQTAAAGLIRNS